MSERYVFPVAPGNADPLDIVVTFTGNVRFSPRPGRPIWEPTIRAERLPRKLKKRLRAYIRRIEERELAIVARWWNARGGQP